MNIYSQACINHMMRNETKPPPYRMVPKISFHYLNNVLDIVNTIVILISSNYIK